MGDDKDDEGTGVLGEVHSEVHRVFERKEEHVLSELDDEGHGVLEPSEEAIPKSMSTTRNPRSDKRRKDY